MNSPRSSELRGEGDWHRFRRGNGLLQRNLHLRSRVLRTIRNFLEEGGFIEVETPHLVLASSQEVHIEPFQCLAEDGSTMFLHTSPELHMKRLLAGGFERVFQLCRCFRSGEQSRCHNSEFTMLEWYRTHAGYEDIMADTESLVASVAEKVIGSTVFSYQGQQVDVTPPWKRVTVHELFEELAEIDLSACCEEQDFRVRATESGFSSVRETDDWEEIFFKILIERIEPAIANMGPSFVLEYPASMAAQARPKEEDPGVAERVEAYIGGLELANGYTELNDPVMQRQRFGEARKKRLKRGGVAHPMDSNFLEMMSQEMPPAAGIALGVDRLVMLLTNSRSIDQVIAFGFGE